MLLCHPYEARARRSEKSCHMRGRADLRSNGKVASLRSAFQRPGPSLTGAKAAAIGSRLARAQSVDTLPLWCGPSGSTQVESVGSARYAQCTGTLSVDPWTSLEWTVRASGPPLSGQWKQWNAVNREITSKAPLRAHKSHKIAQRG